MSFVVPFDGSALAEAALIRAAEFSTVFSTRVVAVSVIPRGNADYARDRDWIGPEESFETSTVVSTLHERVVELVPDADFEHALVESYASAGLISRTIREHAIDADASVVFLGSENAGAIVSGVGDVGPSIAAEDAYDVHIVRHSAPVERHRRDETVSWPIEKSGFHR